MDTVPKPTDTASASRPTPRPTPPLAWRIADLLAAPHGAGHCRECCAYPGDGPESLAEHDHTACVDALEGQAADYQPRHAAPEPTGGQP